jgi:hypothetical protein
MKEREMSNNVEVSGGVTPLTLVGMGLAAFCSWTLNHSIVWAGVHGFFGWFYLLYLCAGFGGGFPAEMW